MTASPANPWIEPCADGAAPAGSALSRREETAWALAAGRGDAEAFRGLVERYQEPLHRFCRHWLRCEEDAREVCQDAFVRAWQALPQWEPRAAFSTWLYHIALNLCRDRARSRHHRQRSRTEALLQGDEHHACPRPAPDTAAGWRSEMEKLFCGLDLLPDKLRAPLVLVVLEGLTHRECAAVLHCSVRGVESRIFRARQRLAKWWQA